jgi:tetratricopeptide (TPR) repeat protein
LGKKNERGLRGGFILLKRSEVYYPLYLAVFVVAAAYVFLTMPLTAGDTDLWYHLSGGRYLFEHGSIASTGFFSFIEPERSWNNYFWLFQAVVYGVYTAAGDTGLVALRALTYLASLWLVFIYLYKKQKDGGRGGGGGGWGYTAFLFVLYAVTLMLRYSNLRPHVFTYIFIPAFILVLEYYPRRAPYLVIAAVLWTNLHGIVYPVMTLIAVSYLAAPLLLRLWRAAPLDVRLAGSLALVPAAVYLTPAGRALAAIPFVSTKYASQYIAELRPLDVKNLFSVTLSAAGLTYEAASNVLVLTAFMAFVAAVAAFMTAFKNRRAAPLGIRPAGLIMFLGGLALLFKGERFTSEFVLLALPVAAANPPFGRMVGGMPGDKKSAPAALILKILLMVLPFLFLNDYAARMNRPLNSFQYLPHGVTEFLRRVNTGGSVLNYPNSGGYLQWRLSPRYRIFIDMEVPFLFTDEDVYVAINAYRDDVVLSKVIDKYHPRYLSVPLKYAGFGRLAEKHPRYVPVFFDDSDALYADSEALPEVAARYGLRSVDPFAMGARDLGRMSVPERALMIGELEKLYEVRPGVVSGQMLAILYNLQGQRDRALKYIAVVTAEFPDQSDAWILKGEILSGMKRYDEAEAALKKALGGAEEGQRAGIFRRLSTCYSNTGRHGEAYEALGKAVDVFSALTPFEDLYALAYAASVAGKPSEAISLLRLAMVKVPPQKVQWRRRIAAGIARHGQM